MSTDKIVRPYEKVAIVGIDPGFTKMGITLKVGDEYEMKTADLDTCIAWLMTTLKKRGLTLRNVVGVIENPDLDSNTFRAWPVFQKALQNFLHNFVLKIGIRSRINTALQWAGFTRKRSSVPIVKPILHSDKGQRMEFNLNSLRAAFGIAMRMASSVAKNKAAAQYTITKFRNAGVYLLEVAPSERQKAYSEGPNGKKVYHKHPQMLKMPTKTNAEQWEILTGYAGRCSEHARDAGTLIYFRSVQNVVVAVELQEAKRANKPESYKDPNNYKLVDRKRETA